MQKRWSVIDTDDDVVDQLQDGLGINRIFCQLLVARGIDNFDKAKRFFRMDASQLNDPFLMKGMKIAVERIKDAIDKNQNILLYGDYDVDGTTSVALVYSFFKHFYDHISFYIPNRFSEGYGLSEKGIEHAINKNVNLIITLDCGIKSIELVAKAKQEGIDTIICDHHLPGEDLPKAYAILNPKQADCEYPYKELCGCGVGYKLVSAYGQQFDIAQELIDEHLDLLACAIAADIVPITAENRTLAYLGLKKANENPSLPIKALKELGDVRKDLSIRDLVFIIGPRVNAAGRMDDATKAVELFIEKEESNAQALAKVLDESNKERVQIDKNITQEATALLQEANEHSTVVYNQNWHKGVVGIVASRLIEKKYRPTIVLTQSNGMVTGSARSIHGFNLFEGLSECSDLLENFGGHYFAAGLTMKEENLPEFKQRFDKIVAEIKVDAEISFEHLGFNFLKIIEEFAPHGPQNLSPIFITKDVTDHKRLSKVVNDKHIRFVVRQWDEAIIFNGIGFHMADKINIVKEKQTFDIVYHIERNVWRDKESLQIRALDIR
jgi:single-stranded-DNA-specific exonuclease